MKLYTEVLILDNSDWHDHGAMVSEYRGDIPLLYSVRRPLDRYWLYPYLEDKIKVL